MAIPRPLIFLWLVLAAGFALIIAVQLHRENARFLPVPGHPARIDMVTDTQRITIEKHHGHWQSDGKPANDQRIEDWLTALRACQGNYAIHDIAPTPDLHPASVTIDGHTYQLGAANPFANANYLTYGERIYLCDQAVKATLLMPAERWLEKPDA